MSRQPFIICKSVALIFWQLAQHVHWTREIVNIYHNMPNSDFQIIYVELTADPNTCNSLCMHMMVLNWLYDWSTITDHLLVMSNQFDHYQLHGQQCIENVNGTIQICS